MEQTINIALAVGVLLNVSKGADMLFLDSQKKQIERYFKIFSVFVNKIKPVNWKSYFLNNTKITILFYKINQYLPSVVSIMLIGIIISTSGELDFFKFIIPSALAFLCAPVFPDQQAIIDRHLMIGLEGHTVFPGKQVQCFKVPYATQGVTLLQPLIKTLVAVAGVMPVVVEGPVETKTGA